MLPIFNKSANKIVSYPVPLASCLSNRAIKVPYAGTVPAKGCTY